MNSHVASVSALLLLWSVIPAAQRLHAQTFVSVQGEVAEPIGSFRDAAGTGYGVRGTLYLHATPEFAWYFSSGYTKWGARNEVPGIDFRITGIPATVGVQWVLTRSIVSPFFGFAIGMNFLETKLTSAAGVLPAVNTDDKESRFVITPQLGLAAHVIGPVGFIVTASYDLMYGSKATPAPYVSLCAGLAAGF